MSRRSRRREHSGKTRWLGKTLVGLAVLALLGVAAGYYSLRAYLHGDAFRKFLSAQVGKATGVTGEFAGFRWDGLAVETDSFVADGSGIITALRADGIRTEVGFGGVRRGVWELHGSSLKRVEVSLDAAARADEAAPAVAKQTAAAKQASRGWFPDRAALHDLAVDEVVVNAVLPAGPARASGVRVNAGLADAPGAYRAKLSGGTISLPFELVPELRLERALARYQDKRIFLTSAEVGAWDGGRIDASGEWDLGSGGYALAGDAAGFKCEDILGADWAKRLTGDMSSSFTVDNVPGHPRASGSLVIRNGVLTALPVLDSLAAYADTRRFRVLTLSEASCDWHWKEGEISLTNLVLSSEGLVRIQGNLVIRGREMDGVFRLGIAPGTLTGIPGAETDVFLPGEHGLLWSPLRITGTLDDPREDLTDRLVAAAGARMFDQIPETGEKVIRFSKTVLGEAPAETIGKGVEIIEKGSGVVREVGGLLEGILGGGRSKEPEE